MANFKQVNKVVQKTHPTVEVVRGEGYVYFSGDAFDQYESIMTHPVSASTEDVIRLALDTLSECHRCGGVSEEPHTCPYRLDVHDDRTSLCTCCDECRSTCADDI